MIFAKPPVPQSPLRSAITAAYRMDEAACVERLLAGLEFSSSELAHIEEVARQLVTAVRSGGLQKRSFNAFLTEYSLSQDEGIALMCLAEALLRVPDNDTRDELILDKISKGDWRAHIGKSESLFVNSTTWGLMLVGKILRPAEGEANHLGRVLKRLVERTSEPVIRAAMVAGMKNLGHQFVVGRTINEALRHAASQKNYLHSFDMLGEGAKTQQDAEHYFNAYQKAIIAVGENNHDGDTFTSNGISIKLSALHPRYELTQEKWMLPQLVQTVRQLALLAKKYNIGLTVDAEEADRLDISLDVIEAVFRDPDLAGWEGFGFALQAYQKRALLVLDWAIDLAHQQKRRLMIRLVKGAYWDYEIKDSQLKGLNDYPVFTRKTGTDVSYLAAAKKMLSVPEAIYPQFGTHNAYTVAAILEMAQGRRDFEFQALYGMGHALYDHIIGANHLDVRCRIYAPVGSHEELLGYLMRRLLENGANTSFVHQIVDQQIPIKDLIANPMQKLQHYESKRHPNIPLPRDIFGAERKNSRGLDLSNLSVLDHLAEAMTLAAKKNWLAGPMIGKNKISHDTVKVTNPSNLNEVIGEVTLATAEDVTLALQRAKAAAPKWDATPVEQRAQYLERCADLLERHMPELMTLAIREAGKNIFDALGEVREAVDCCRYYAVQARHELATKNLQGVTGETNQLQMHGRGVIACISPWNFPLAIFTGQVVAALVAGNAVIAKPARQTPLIAARAIELFYEAGIPNDVLQLLPGKSEIIGAALLTDPCISGIIMTGSTETARSINQTLAKRPGPILPLIAETGGQNALIADSTALPEQLITDVMASAFNSAGQRCSALRVLFLQEEIADKVIRMLQGAMALLQVGDPGLMQTDIGPVIDQDAKGKLEAHIEYLMNHGKLIYQVMLPESCHNGTFFPPSAFEISDLSLLKHEVFGPILHVIRYQRKDLDKVIAAINNTGFGLTLGIHSRINETFEYIQSRVHAGNAYVNRNIIGAVIGVQPFGGEGLSGTGPKVGGPHYLPRLAQERTLTINTSAVGGNTSLMTLSE